MKINSQSAPVNRPSPREKWSVWLRRQIQRVPAWIGTRLLALLLLLGARGATAGGYTNNFTLSAGTVDSTRGCVGVVDGQWKFTKAGTCCQYATLQLRDLDPGAAVLSFTATFDLTIYATNNYGSGFSLNFANPSSYPPGGSPYVYENGVGTGLKFYFLTYSGGFAGIANGGETPDFGQSLMCDGSKQPVTISYNRQTGASMTYRGQTVTASASDLSGINPLAGWKFLFAARCGGESQDALIDNLVITTVPQSANANLTALTTSGGTLSPAFASNLTNYTVTVPNASNNITLTPVTAQSNATVTINGTAVASGSASGGISLNVGANLITTIVTAENGGTRTYLVTVVRETGLAGLVLNTGTLTPVFDLGTTNYTVILPNATTSLTVTPTAEANATITVNGANTASGTPSGNLALSVGTNTIAVVVSGPNGAPAKTYAILATRTSLPTVSSPTVSSVTATGATLGGNVTSDGGAPILAMGVVLAPTANNSNPLLGVANVVNLSAPVATGVFTVSAGSLLPGTAYSFAAYATNISGISYSSLGGFTTADARLANLTLSAGSLTPAFNPDTTNYTLSVGPTTLATTITPTASSANSTISLNGAPVASGVASSSLPLNPGTTTFTLVVTAADGVTARSYTVALTAVNRHYVWANSPSPAAPFTNWNNAAHDIQSAVEAAAAGELVLVTNGIYATGGRAIAGGVLTNRVALSDSLTLLSVNGPSVTTIQGFGTIGDAAVRCARLGAGATLSGFTLAGGATRNTGGDETLGGGVWCPDATATVTNCVITGSKAYGGGGGTYKGTIRNSTISNNSVPTYAYAGGGAFSSGLINCLISGNQATIGGGINGGFAYNCIITGNQAVEVFPLPFGQPYAVGGGAYNCSELRNCTIVNNFSDEFVGGVAYGALYNSIVYGNRAYGLVPAESFSDGPNTSTNYPASFAYSCTYPLRPGTGNISSNPGFDGTGVRLSVGSPCREAGNNAYAIGGPDPDGNPRIVNGTVDMGAYEFVYPKIIVLASNGVVLSNNLTAPTIANGTDFGYSLINGTPPTSTFGISNAAFGILTISAVSLSGANPADFEIISYPASVGSGSVSNLVVKFVPQAIGLRSATITIASSDLTNANYSFAVQGTANGVGTRYVSLNSPTPAIPYASWQTAAHTIQAALDVSFNGDLILVTNGTYSSGGLVYDGMSNRVVITNLVTLQSVNGPAVTTIQGARDPLTTNGPAAVRCLYLKANNSLVSGFTLSGGATQTNNSASGGGVYCSGGSTLPVLTNCIITGNSAFMFGGGAYLGTLNNCTITSNTCPSGSGGGAQGSVLNGCTVAGNSALAGGGIISGMVNNSILTGNRATGYANGGGGAGQTTLINSLICSNVAFYGGGVDYSTLYNCTVVYNSATNGGGVIGSSVYNSIVYFNTDLVGNPNYYDNYPYSTFANSCTTPAVGGVGNIADNPLLVGPGNFRLAAGSPAIDAGNNAYGQGATDLDGKPRLAIFNVDMGAYEFIPVVATNSVVLSGQTLLPSGAFRFNFSNSEGAFFSILSTTNLALPLANWTWLGSASDLGSGIYQFTDTSATNSGMRFYQVVSP